jgi:hypothetical protein
MSIIRPLTLLCCLTFLSFVTTGCGRAREKFERVVVSGEVLFDGKPVPHGAIWFEPDLSTGTDSPTGFATIRDGKFKTDLSRSPKAGKHVIRITGSAQSREELAKNSATDEVVVEPLFPEYTQPIEITEGGASLEVSIPKNTGKKS